MATDLGKVGVVLKGDWSNSSTYEILDYIHDRVVEEIEELRRVYTPPEEMMEKWDADHKKYIEKAAWIRQMLAM